MFILDDILLSPVKGFMWIVRELHKNAQEQIESESEDLTARLSTLYMMLETGQITQEQFDEQEREILDRLDAIEAGGAEAEEGEVSGEEADAEDDDADDEEPEDEDENVEDDAGLVDALDEDGDDDDEPEQDAQP